MISVFLSGADGYHTYRIPSLVKASDGSLVAICEGRVNSPQDSGNIDLVCKRSEDFGQSWSSLTVVTNHGTDTAGNPCLVVDPVSDDIVLVSCRNGGSDSSDGIRTGSDPARRVYVQRSGDCGVSWSAPSEISAQARLSWMRWYATGPGHGTCHSSTGRLVIPCNHSRSPSGSDTGAERKYSGGHCIYSEDGGISWTVGFTSSNANGSINEDESTVCELDDGTLYFNCRCDAEDERPSNRADLYSADGGTTAINPYVPQGSLITPVVQGSVINTPFGLVFSSPNHPDGRVALGLWTSEDDGDTWYFKKYVTGKLSAYSDMVLMDFQTIGLIYETGRWNNYERIDFTTVSLSELF